MNPTEEEVNAMVEQAEGSLTKDKAREILIGGAIAAAAEEAAPGGASPKLSTLKGAATRALKAAEEADQALSKAVKAANAKPDNAALKKAADEAQATADATAAAAKAAAAAVASAQA